MKSNVKAIVLVFALLSIITSVDSVLKQILGAVMAGDLLPGLYSFKCLTSKSNFTTFLLYSRNHPDDPRVMIPFDWKSLQKSEYDPTNPTKIIIHGFVDNMRLSDWMIRMKNALLKDGDYNVIITDWSCGNGFPYAQAVANSKKTADKLIDLFTFLQQARGADPRSFHLIGHSLGCQIAGMVGHRIPFLGRISGLDPAGPKFYDVAADETLDPTDALFVDVIHTDAGYGLFEGLGLGKRQGHVDFYPNGGKNQPGCHSSPVEVLSRLGLQRAARYYVTCDHYRAVDLYLESIGSIKSQTPDSYCDFVGVQCRDWTSFAQGRCADCAIPGNCAVMGYYSDAYPFRLGDNGATEFFIQTSEVEPFCVHQYQVILETAAVGSGPRETVVEFEAGINSGVVYVEVTTETGKINKFPLNEHDHDHLKPNKRYVYLATSKFPLGEIRAANLWWGSTLKPTPISTTADGNIGFKIRKIEITPILFADEPEERSIGNNKVKLCIDEDTLIARSLLYDLSINDC